MKKKKTYLITSITILCIVLYTVIKININKNKSRVTDRAYKGKLEVTVMASGELVTEKFKSINAPVDELRQHEIWEVSIAYLIPEGTVVDSGDIVAELDRTKITEKLNEIEKTIQLNQEDLESSKLDTSIELSAIRDELQNSLYNIEEMKFTLEQSKYESPAVIKQAKNQLEKAEREYDQSLKNQKLKTKKAESTINQQKWEIQQLIEKRNSILNLMGRFTILSPGKGMIGYYKGRDGQKIEAGSTIQMWSSPIIATLPNFTSMNSNVYVNEIDISKIKNGQKVRVNVDAFPDKSFKGTITFIANIGEQLPSSDAKVFNVIVKLNETDPVLKPGMTTNNTIYTSVFDNVVYVPIEAVYFNETDTFVYKTNGLNKTKQKVKVGEFNDNYIVINEGLKENDKIILSR